MNTITLVGRLATDPRLEEVNGNQICTFRIAVDRGGRDGADFFPIKCFGAQAANHHTYLAKGRLVGIEGRLSHSQWTDNEGQNRERYEVTANRVSYLSSPPKTDEDVSVEAPKEPVDSF